MKSTPDFIPGERVFVKCSTSGIEFHGTVLSGIPYPTNKDFYLIQLDTENPNWSRAQQHGVSPEFEGLQNIYWLNKPSILSDEDYIGYEMDA